MPLHLTKRLRLFEVADYWCISCESWRWLKVFIVSFNHAFQLKIPLVIIFKLAYVAVESWTKYVSYFLSHMAPSYPSMTCPLTQPINQCCSLACWGRNQTSTLYFFVGGGNMATACMQLPGKLPFHRVFHRFDPVKNARSQVLRFSTPQTETLLHWRLLECK